MTKLKVIFRNFAKAPYNIIKFNSNYFEDDSFQIST